MESTPQIKREMRTDERKSLREEDLNMMAQMRVNAGKIGIRGFPNHPSPLGPQGISIKLSFKQRYVLQH